MAKPRKTIQYRGRQIVAMAHGAIILPQKHTIDGNGIDECVSNAKAYIDSMYQERMKQRAAPHIGTVEDYAEALNYLTLGAHLRAMLSAHYNAEGKAMTASELAESAGWKSFSSANNHYGNLGKQIAEHVGLALDGRDDQAWTEALATFDEETRQWTMHSELADALLRLNLT